MECENIVRRNRNRSAWLRRHLYRDASAGADALKFIRPAMGPDDELPPFIRTLQSGAGTVGQNDGASPVRFLGSRIQNPLGDGMTDWSSSVDPSSPQYFAQPAPSPQQPGGLPGLMLNYLRDNPNN